MKKYFVIFECGCQILKHTIENYDGTCPKHGLEFEAIEEVKACTACGKEPVMEGNYFLGEYCFRNKENPDEWETPHDFVE